MKELTKEDKARRYDEVINRMKHYVVDEYGCSRIKVADVFPELSVSEDEKIKKEIIALIEWSKSYNASGITTDEANEMLAWLENQGERKTTDKIQIGKEYKCIASPRYSTFMTGKIYKPEDKFLCSFMNFCSDCFESIEDSKPKFKNGDRVRNKKSGLEQTLGSCIVDVYEGAFPFRIKDQDDWELVKQTPVDKVEPKFKVGDIIHCKLDNRTFVIKEVDLKKGVYTYTEKGCGNDIDYADEMFELVEPNPYSGTSFVYNNHTWGMCARDGGIDILCDSKLIKHIDEQKRDERKEFEFVLVPFGTDIKLEKDTIIIPDGYVATIDGNKIYIKKEGKGELEAVKEEKVDNANKVEPKFKVGEWIIQENIGVYEVAEICESWYEVIDVENKHYSIGFDKEYMCRLWTIEDAKDGDVLAISWWEDKNLWEKIIIFKKCHNEGVEGLYSMPCVEGYGNTFKNGEVVFAEEVPYYSKTWTSTLHPATKEQRELLFSKMEEERNGL